MKSLGYDFQNAREIVLKKCMTMETETVPLEKAAGRILAKNLTARYCVPLFDKSPLDGYAFMASDTSEASRENPAELTIVEEIPAGSCSAKRLKSGTAVKILTGAPIPAGATAVAKYEETEYGTDHVKLFRPYQEGENIILKGEDICENQVIAARGELVDCALHSMMASQGITEAKVYKTPLIGIISQGNELLNPGETLKAGKIYNTNRYMIGTVLKQEDISSIFLGTSQDNEAEIARMLTEAVSMYDVVIMTGGVSVGTYDYTEEAMKRAGAEILVDRIFMKPGSACCLGILNGVPVFGLSGNPAAAITTFYLVVLPVIRKMAGKKNYLPQEIKVRLDEDYKKESKNTRILKGKLDLSDGTAVMHLNQKQGNGMVTAMYGTDVFAVVPAGTKELKAGCMLDAYMI